MGSPFIGVSSPLLQVRNTRSGSTGIQIQYQTSQVFARSRDHQAFSFGWIKSILESLINWIGPMDDIVFEV